MRAASLLLVFALAKVSVLAGHHVPVSVWSPIAYLWQDAAVVLVFALLEFLLGRRQRVAWMLYGALALYAAINVPVTRVLATPLTWFMWRAAGGALADSIWHYATWQNAVLFVSVLVVAIVAPIAFRRTPPQPSLVPLLAFFVALGPASVVHVDTLGLERNAWAALAATAMPRIGSRESQDDWRASPFANRVARAAVEDLSAGDLSRFSGAASGRNIVLVSLESTAAQYLGLYGADPDVMPNLSELAHSAIVFDNAYATYPESIKGLFSILCSAYPALDSAAESYAAVPCSSVAAVLTGNGYRTAMFHSGRFGYLSMDAVIRNRGFSTLADAGDIGGNHSSSFGVDEPSAVRRILEWIDTVPAGQPFFVTYLPIAGHHPYDAPEPGPYRDADEFGRYRNALHYGDRSLATLVAGLRARGLEQKTVWIFLGDHGEAFGQHEGNYGHTFQLYDENVHVPLLIAVPGLISHQIRSRHVVSLVDTAPTILDLAGLRAPDSYQGTSMLDTEPRVALFLADYSLALLGLRDGSTKFIYELDSGRTRLFDVQTDPREKIDLSDREADRTRWYARNLRSWSAAQRHRLTPH